MSLISPGLDLHLHKGGTPHCFGNPDIESRGDAREGMRQELFCKQGGLKLSLSPEKQDDIWKRLI